MALQKDAGSYPGHDEGTNAVPNASFVNSPAVHAPLQTTADAGTTVKNDLGTTGKPEGAK